MTPAEQVKEKLLELQNALLNQHPLMPTLLQTIHKQLKADPEVVTVLTEEEIAVYVEGCKRQTNTVVAEKVMKVSAKKMKNLSVDDI